MKIGCASDRITSYYNLLIARLHSTTGIGTVMQGIQGCFRIEIVDPTTCQSNRANFGTHQLA
jgi:hypothetical protein